MLLLLSLLLAQSSPGPAASAASVAPVRVHFPSTSAASGTLPPVAQGDAVIRNSGSTNTAGYTIVVHPDATAELAQGSSTTRTAVSRGQAETLFAKIAAAGPLDAMPAGHCMKSASFGTTTTVTFAGKTSGDLSCGAGSPYTQLWLAAVAIANQVGATPFASHFRHTL